MNLFGIFRHRRDLPFLLTVLMNLAVIGLYLGQELSDAGEAGKTWRRIDTEAVQRLLDMGELSDREALWYHSTDPAEPPKSPGGGQGTWVR